MSEGDGDSVHRMRNTAFDTRSPEKNFAKGERRTSNPTVCGIARGTLAGCSQGPIEVKDTP